MRRGYLPVQMSSQKVLQFQNTNKTINVFTRLLTPVRLHRIFPNSSQLCFKHWHSDACIFGNCDKIKTYWKEIHKIIHEIIGNTFVLSPKLYLQQICFLTVIKNVYWFFYRLGHNIYTILWSSIFNQYMVESGDQSFTTGQINLWFIKDLMCSGPLSGTFLRMLTFAVTVFLILFFLMVWLLFLSLFLSILMHWNV